MRFSTVIFGALALLTTSVVATTPSFTTCESQCKQVDKDAKTCNKGNAKHEYPLIVVDINALTADIQAQVNAALNINAALNLTVQAAVLADLQALVKLQLTAFADLILVAPFIVLVDVNAHVQLALKALLAVYVQLFASLKVCLSAEVAVLASLLASLQAEAQLCIAAYALVSVI